MSITIFAPSGEATDYRTVSERLPEFEKMFPVADGYRIIRSHISAKEFGSEIVHLYEKAIENGHSPRDVGLPFIEGFGVVFKAELFKGETLIRNASAYKQVTQTKDWEAGETAAFQRLMAACGLGGSDMDSDDQYDRISSGLEVPPEYRSDPEPEQIAQQEPEPTFSQEPEPAPVEEAPKPASKPASVQKAPQKETKAVEAQKEPSETATQTTPPNNGATEEIRPQLLNQLAHVANLAGEPIPEVTTVKEAKAEIKRLNALSRAS